MIVLVTGMVGINKKAYLEGVCSLAEVRGKKVLLCNVGDMMYGEAPDVGAGRILDIPLKRLHLLRRSVLKDIIAKTKEHEHVIVNTHATFRWRHGLFPAFDFDQVRELGADMYICLVDGVDALHVRLVSEHSIQHTLKDLLVWREEEILATEMMRNGTDEDALFYCLSRGGGEGTVEMFYRLLFEGGCRKAYLSFPMTHVMGMEAIVAEIGGFRKSMKEIFTCFDPGDLEEAYLPYYAKKAVEEGRDYVELDVLGHKVRFDAAEVVGIQGDINSQIYARDFLLIDQADMIVSYIPELEGGRAAISSGVERELQHAHEAAKEVYVIWRSKAEPSVFITQTATRVFRDTVQAAKYFCGENGV
jgi:adenylate kinase